MTRPQPSTRALLSLGSNLGDRSGFLRGAVVGLGEAAVVVSGVYESPPWPPGEPGPAYLNAAVLAVDAGSDPRHWL
ncbi:MAG: 2-amino-4-hydroxy-6-hydroxymethyldihydropteridine diphosphokinase, partial [Natronosporangium sp.]